MGCGVWGVGMHTPYILEGAPAFIYGDKKDFLCPPEIRSTEVEASKLSTPKFN